MQFNISDVPKLIGVSFVADANTNIEIIYNAMYRYLKRDLKKLHSQVFVDETITAIDNIDQFTKENFVEAEPIETNMSTVTRQLVNQRETLLVDQLQPLPEPSPLIMPTIDVPASVTTDTNTTRVVGDINTTCTIDQSQELLAAFSQLYTISTCVIEHNIALFLNNLSDIKQQLVIRHHQYLQTLATIEAQIDELSIVSTVEEQVYTSVIKQNGVVQEKNVYAWLQTQQYNLIEKQKHCTVRYVDVLPVPIILSGIADAITPTHVIEIKNRAAKLKPVVPPYETMQVRLYMNALGAPYNKQGIVVQCFKGQYQINKVTNTQKNTTDDQFKIVEFARRYYAFMTSEHTCNRFMELKNTAARKQFLIDNGVLMTQKNIKAIADSYVIKEYFNKLSVGATQSPQHTQPHPHPIICVFDVETHNSVVIEFAYVLYNGEKIIEKGFHLVRHDNANTYKPNGINDITAELLLDQGVSVSASKTLISSVFNRADILCGYNCKSDLTLISKTYDLPTDTYKICCIYNYIKTLTAQSVSLSSLHSAHHPTTVQSHRALDDCMMLLNCYDSIRKHYPNMIHAYL